MTWTLGSYPAFTSRLFQEMGVAVSEAGGQADPPLGRTADPQRHPHSGAELHRDRVHEARKAPRFNPAPDFLEEGARDGVGVRHGSGSSQNRGGV